MDKDTKYKQKKPQTSSAGGKNKSQAEVADGQLLSGSNNDLLDNLHEHIPLALKGLPKAISVSGLEKESSYLFNSFVPDFSSHGRSDVTITLHKFAREGNEAAIRMIMKRSNLRLKQLVNKKDSEGLTALHYAARFNHYDCVRILVDEGKADVNILDDSKANALHFAARYRRRKSVLKQYLFRSQNKSQPRLFGLKGSNGSGGGGDQIKSTPDSWNTQNNKRLLEEEQQPSKENSVILYLVSRGADVNQQDIHGCTPLHYAAMRGNEIAAQHLLMVHADCEKEDREQMRPLHLACSYKHYENVKLLLDHHAELMCRESSGCLPLHLASANDNRGTIVQLLLEEAERRREGDSFTMSDMINCTDNDMNTPLHAAVKAAHVNNVRHLIERGADGNCVNLLGQRPTHFAASIEVTMVQLLHTHNSLIDCPDNNMRTPLFWAAERNLVDVVNYLVDNGANVEQRDNNSLTPLLMAAVKGKKQTVEQLLKKNANPMATDKDTKSALYLAAEQNQLDTVKTLLTLPEEHGLIEMTDRFNNTPLHVACKRGYSQVAKALLAANARVEAKNDDERTPLHCAAKFGRTQIIRLLLANSSRAHVINCEDQDSNTPLHLAASKGHAQVVQLLLDAGADINASNGDQWTALDCAAACGNLSVVEVLLKNDYPVNPVDKTKITPLYLACSKGHPQVVTLLLQKKADVSRRATGRYGDPITGSNPLDAAIDNGHKECALAIIQSDSWQDALRNQTCINSNEITTPMRKLIQKMPDVAEQVFRRCTETNKMHMDHREFLVIFNYEFLEDTYADWGAHSPKFRPFHTGHDKLDGSLCESELDSDFIDVTNNNPGNQFYDIDNRISSKSIPYSKDTDYLKSNHPLMVMVNSKRENLLNHPLVVGLLNQKWRSFGRPVYYFNLLAYALFLAFFTIYILFTPPTFSFTNTYKFTINNNINKSTCQQIREVSNNTIGPQAQAAYMSKYAVMGLIVFSVIKEILQFYEAFGRYLNLENLIEWSVYVLSFITVFDFTACERETGIREAWQWQTGSAAIFLSWLNLILFLRKTTALGIYVVMFTDVCKTFARFFLVFFLFLLAFAFGFYCLLCNQNSFSTLPKALLKTTVMMIGELDYSSVWDSQYESQHYDSFVFYETISYMLFVSFLIVMNILIMNLLVGLAVDDIKVVQEQAALKRLAMQVEMTLTVESLMPHWLRRQFIVRAYSLQPNRKGNFIQNLLAKFAPIHKTHLLKYLLSEASDVEKLQKSNDRMSIEMTQMQQQLQTMQLQNQRLSNMTRALMQHFQVEYNDAEIDQE